MSEKEHLNYQHMKTNKLDKVFFQAKIQKFDKNFFNFEDPEVYRKFINPNETEIWKKTYGYDYACTYNLDEKYFSAKLRSANIFMCKS